MINRRQFLRIVAVGGVAGVAGLALKSGWDALTGLETTRETRLLMGTIVNLTAITPPGGQGRAAVEAAFARMAALERVFSRHMPESDLSRLNAAGRLPSPSAEMLEVLAAARQMSEWSAGAFDVTMLPLLNVYALAARDGTLPTAEQVDAARALVDYRSVVVTADEVRLERPGMSLTLDAIAKGYIVDAGVRVLNAHGLPNTLVEAGGDLYAAGGPLDGAAWQLGVQAPRAGGPALAARLGVHNQAVATSGDYMQPFSPDLRHHHILDPRTGLSSPELASATVVASRAHLADALATTVMVLGRDLGLALARRAGAEAVVIAKSGEIARSPGFPAA